MSVAEELTTIAENTPKIFNAGYEKGKAENTDSYYDNFWDIQQTYGERRSYIYAFCCDGWTNDTFKPKYIPLVCTDVNMMFYCTHITEIEDGIIDTSQCTSIGSIFYGAKIKTAPELDCSSATNLTNAFRESHVVRVKLNNIRRDCVFSNTFGKCNYLTDIGVTGEIGNSINVSASSKVTAESAKSVLTHLVNYAGTDNAYTQKASFHSNTWALLNAEGETSPDGTTWAVYVDNKGWNY